VAPDDDVQLSVGVTDCAVAPLLGESNVTAGSVTCVKLAVSVIAPFIVT
jgi:hypothetical protein